MNFRNEFELIESADPDVIFSIGCGYGQSGKDGELAPYVLNDEGFRTAIFQRAFHLIAGHYFGEINNVQYRTASLIDNSYKCRFLTDFNFLYYSERAAKFYLSRHEGHKNPETIDYEKERQINNVFESLSRLHDFPSIIKEAHELFEDAKDDMRGTIHSWDVLYAHGWEL